MSSNYSRGLTEENEQIRACEERKTRENANEIVSINEDLYNHSTFNIFLMCSHCNFLAMQSRQFIHMAMGNLSISGRVFSRWYNPGNGKCQFVVYARGDTHITHTHTHTIN